MAIPAAIDNPADEAILFFTPEWNGMHPGAWRLPDSDRDGAMDFAVVRRLVEAAEHAKFHAVFLADPLGFRLHLDYPALARTATAVRYEPFTLMSALSVATDRIGLIMTAGTTYDEPFHVARRFASLDHLSGGRAGWNVVTSGDPAGSRLFGHDEHAAHDDRYARGHEFVEAVQSLWDTWSDDAFVDDPERGVYFETDRMHDVAVDGSWLRAAGPLNVPRPVQGYPVMAQAGSSTTGRAFAAKYAEMVFTLQADIAASAAFRRQIREEAAAFGRDPRQVKVMPSLTLVVDHTEEAALARLDAMDALVDDEVGLQLLSAFVQMDLTGLSLDDRLPEVEETSQTSQTIQRFFVEKARQDDLDLRGLVSFMLRWGAVGGTPIQIADRIETWIRAGACDGFNVTFADMPRSMDLFCAEVIPLLQERGVFHKDYAGETLRESLGLDRPANRYETEAAR